MKIQYFNTLHIQWKKNVGIAIPFIFLILVVLLSIPSPSEGYGYVKRIVDTVAPIDTHNQETVITTETSIAVSSDNLAHIVYYDAEEKALKYAKQVCNQQPCHWDCLQTCPWSVNIITHITSDSKLSYHYPSIAVDSKNIVHVSYIDHDLGQLNYAKLENGQWTITVVPTNIPAVLIHASIKVDSEGVPHIVFLEDDSEIFGTWRINHIKKLGNNWQYDNENVYTGDSDIGFGMYLSFDLDTKRNPQVSFYDTGNRLMMYSYKKYGDMLGIYAAQASGNEAGNPASNVLDTSLDTRWANQGAGSSIRADLGDIGASMKTCSLDIAWYKGNERKYNYIISTSDDGTTFTNRLTGTSSGQTLDPEKYTFRSIDARYVKVTVNGYTDPINGNGDWASITDLDVFGASPNCPYWKTEDIHLQDPNQPKKVIDDHKAYSPSIAVDSTDTPHIVFIYSKNDPIFGDVLVHAKRVKSFIWNTYVVDSWPTLRDPSIAIKYNENHFVYLWWWNPCYDCIGFGGNGAYALTDYLSLPGSGSDLDFEGIGIVKKGPVSSPSMAVDNNGYTHIVYLGDGNTITYIAIAS